MKQIGFTKSDRDDHRPDPKKKGRQNGGRTRTSGGAAGVSGGKFRNVKLGFQRKVPKFLQKYSHLLGVKPKRPKCPDEIFASKEEFVDREDEQPTIVGHAELGSQPKRKRRAQTIDDMPGFKRRDDGSAKSKPRSKPESAGTAMERLQAIGLISPAMAKVAQVKADTQAKADAEAALLAKEKALIQSINQKRLKTSAIASVGKRVAPKPHKKEKRKKKKKKRRSKAVQDNKLLSFGEF